MREEKFLKIKNPLLLLKTWLKKANKIKIEKPNAATLSTSDLRGKVASRTILLKQITMEELFFYTNYKSLKGQHLSQNPFASLLFYWPELRCQIHTTGKVKKISRKKTEIYWKTRTRASQISQWISPQSRPVRSHQNTKALHKEALQKFKGSFIPCPPDWGGYTLSPQTFEILLEKPHRLHDRFFYKRKKHLWFCQKLFP